MATQICAARPSVALPSRAVAARSTRNAVMCRSSPKKEVQRATVRNNEPECGKWAAGAASLSVPLLLASPAYAMDGPLSIFNDNPALLGATCVAVCWGIPQGLGMGLLEAKESKARAQLEEWGVDTSDVGKGQWGMIRNMVMEEAAKRGVDYKP